ncbi:8672_t:CDS:2 [Acaulospora morrowiae]|uniref:8672_t:CDS:1 n=1 Tax=Acaulospora morrowiae TaxID=94023 RepID=A0A9N9AFL6_9GLOM|nr:8672_t:CDS:2 [Acaulospora morrowiae]
MNLKIDKEMVVVVDVVVIVVIGNINLIESDLRRFFILVILTSGDGTRIRDNYRDNGVRYIFPIGSYLGLSRPSTKDKYIM